MNASVGNIAQPYLDSDIGSFFVWFYARLFAGYRERNPETAFKKADKPLNLTFGFGAIGFASCETCSA